MEQAHGLLGTLNPQVPTLLQLPLLRARADLSERRGEGAAALALRRTALRFSLSLHGEGKVETAVCRVELAETLLRLGQRPAALEALQHSVPTLERLQIEGAPERRRVEGLMLLARGGRG